jgi:hypothetical protein
LLFSMFKCVAFPIHGLYEERTDTRVAAKWKAV